MELYKIALNKGKVGLSLQGYCPICEIKNYECVKLDRTIKDGNLLF